MDSSRFGLLGSAKIYGDSADYMFEVEAREALSSQLNQFNDNNAQSLKMRWSSMYHAAFLLEDIP